ncbi:G protein-coupled receptor [Sarotherodon galilaeus]
MSGELETWSNVLHSLLEGFVKRRGHDVLKDQLPSKEEPVDSFRPGESSPVPIMTCQASALPQTLTLMITTSS